MNIDPVYYYGFPAITIFLLIVILYLQYGMHKYQEDITNSYNEIQSEFAKNADIIFKKTISDFENLFKQIEKKIAYELENSNCAKKMKEFHQEINGMDIEIKNLNHHIEKFSEHNRGLIKTAQEKDKLIQELEAILRRKTKQIARLKEKNDI